MNITLQALMCTIFKQHSQVQKLEIWSVSLELYFILEYFLDINIHTNRTHTTKLLSSFQKRNRKTIIIGHFLQFMDIIRFFLYMCCSRFVRV